MNNIVDNKMYVDELYLMQKSRYESKLSTNYFFSFTRNTFDVF